MTREERKCLRYWDIAIQALEQKAKTGHWIVHEHAEEFYGRVVDNYECDNCGDWYLNKTNFCPNCGAKMVEPQNLKYADNDTMMPAT